jgi:uncharacterized repeat protein (TIGR02543 family)
MEFEMKDRLLFGFLTLSALVFFGCSMPTDDTSYNGYDDAPEEEKTWTVSFMSQGGSYVEPFYNVKEGSVISLPDPPVREGYVFQGWYYDNRTFLVPFTSSTPVTPEYGWSSTYGIRVYAKWTQDTSYTTGVLPEGSLNEKFRVIADRADKNVIYTILISEDTECDYWDIVTRGINVIIEIRSADPASPKKISRRAGTALFSINESITVKLQDIIIQGRTDSMNSMIKVNGGGTLELLGGAKITGNKVDGIGGGVSVFSNGSLILDGGEICYNSSTSWGGGVLVDEGGQFTLKSGSIHHNSAGTGTAADTWGSAWGGGVGVYQGTFTMSGGEIYANTAVVGGGVGIYGTGYTSLPSQFVKKPPFGSTTSGIIYGADGPPDKKNTATLNTANGPKCAAVAFHDGQPYGDISYRTNTLDNYTGITTDNRSAVWEARIREYNL